MEDLKKTSMNNEENDNEETNNSITPAIESSSDSETVNRQRFK